MKFKREVKDKRQRLGAVGLQSGWAGRGVCRGQKGPRTESRGLGHRKSSRGEATEGAHSKDREAGKHGSQEKEDIQGGRRDALLCQMLLRHGKF